MKKIYHVSVSIMGIKMDIIIGARNAHTEVLANGLKKIVIKLESIQKSGIGIIQRRLLKKRKNGEKIIKIISGNIGRTMTKINQEIGGL